MSYVPQEISVWTDISGYENLLIYAKLFGVQRLEGEKIIDEVLESMGLKDVEDDLVKTYSGGMIRRLEIAWAMLIKPKIMFLDEPTIGLDPAARRVVWERLNVFKKEYGVTIFFNTHYMDEAESYADEIAIINKGKIVALGKSEELRRYLGGEIITFTIDKTTLEPNMIQRMQRLSFVKNVFENGNLSVLVSDVEFTLPRLMSFLKDEGVYVEKVFVTKPSLDDVFLKYAGTRVEEKGRISDVTHIRTMIRKG